MEYWPARIATRSVAGGSVGVLRQVRIAPRGPGVGGAARLTNTGPQKQPRMDPPSQATARQARMHADKA
jgi:hypothetical protein